MAKDQYQHFIPRFILRYFQDAQTKPQNKKERQKRFWKDRRTGTDSDTVLMYELASQTFEARPISKIYGATNLYRDVRNIENVDHLEEAFSRLENEASIILKNVHSSLTPTSHPDQFQMKRKELNTLRKFLFLMFQRKATLAQSYYDEDHAENAAMRDWLKASREKAQINTKEEMWLHGLRYHLFTPHHQIVAEGEAIKQRHGTPHLAELAKLDLDVTSSHAIDYETMANGYFLGIWEAAIGEEFILTTESFGLWEGGPGQLHRIFVMGPRIALVLRPCLFSHIPRETMNSNWLDIPLKWAGLQYANFEPDSDDGDALSAYRTTQWAQEDVFTFQIIRLTADQTHLVNNTLLVNAKSTSSVTFSSTTAMINTTQAFLNSKDPFDRERAYLFRNLLGILLDPIVGPMVNPPQSPFDIVLGSIVSGAIEIPSMYNRAHRIHSLATDNTSKYARTSSEIHKMTALGITKLKHQLGLPDLMVRFLHQMSLVPIVTELPKEEAELFFALAGHQIDKLGVGPQGEGMLERLKYEAAVIGVVHWIAVTGRGILHEWLYPWVDIFAK